MRKIILLLMIMISVMINPSLAHAQSEAGNTAMLKHPLITSPALKIESIPTSNEIKKQTIKAVLAKYNSPLTDEDIEEFLVQCKDNEINCYLLPSIFGVESSFCTALWPNSHNCAGWGGGYIMFPSYKEGIKTISQALKKNYIGRGAVTVERVGKIYAESGAWPTKVRTFLGMFEREEQRQIKLMEEKERLIFSSNDVK